MPRPRLSNTLSRRGWKRPSPLISANPSKIRTAIPFPLAKAISTSRNLQPLSKFLPGQRVLIREVKDDSPERLRRWQTLGLTPGATVLMLSHQPLDDLFEVQVGGQKVPLGSEGLVGLFGELARE